MDNSDNTGLILGITIVALIIIILIAVLIYYFYFRNNGEDLSGEDITGEDLTGEDLTGEDLTGEDLTGEDLTGEDLTGGEDLAKPTNKPVVVNNPSSTGTLQKGQLCNDQQKCTTGFECRQNSCISANAPSGCYYGPFGPLSSCSEVCGGGVQSKTRMVLKPDGSYCNFPPIRESKPCNTQACSTVPQHAGLTVEENIDYYGADMPNMPIGPFDNANQCASSCSTTDGCQSYSWLSPNAPWVKENPESKGECYLKNKVGHRRVSAGIFGGKKVV